MSVVGWKTVAFERQDARDLAKWIRDWTDSCEPSILGGCDLKVGWRPAISELERVSRRAALGMPRLSVTLIKRLRDFLHTVLATPFAPPRRFCPRSPEWVVRIYQALKTASRGRGQARYSANLWASAAKRTAGGLGSDAQRLARRQRKNSRDLLAWESWLTNIAAARETILTTTVPIPVNRLPAPRKKRDKNRPIKTPASK